MSIRVHKVPLSTLCEGTLQEAHPPVHPSTVQSHIYVIHTVMLDTNYDISQLKAPCVRNLWGNNPTTD